MKGHDILPLFWRIKFPAFSGGRMSFRNLVPAEQTVRCQLRSHNKQKLQVLDLLSKISERNIDAGLENVSFSSI
jgi:hypothetical protein